LIIISLKSCHISFFLNVVFLQRIASTPAVHQWRGKLNHFSLARSGTKVSRKTVFSILAESGPVKLASSAGKHVVPWFTIVISIYKIILIYLYPISKCVCIYIYINVESYYIDTQTG
jgi:hypothetical protein